MALIHEWLLKDNLKDTAGTVDLVPYGSGVAQYKNGKVYLDGNYGLKTPTAMPLPTTYTLSIMAGVENASTGFIQMLFGNGMGNGGVGSAAQGIAVGYNNVCCMTGGGDSQTKTVEVLVPNILKHYVMTISNGSVINIYADGQPIVVNANVSSATMVNPITIGGFVNSPTTGSGVYWGFTKGNIANARIYNSVLTPSEVLSLYASDISTIKYLVLSAGNLLSYQGAAWNTVGSFPATEALFKAQGMYTMQSKAGLDLLPNTYSVFGWTTDTTKLSAVASVKAVPFAQVVLAKGDISLESVECINYASIIDTEALIVISVDSGLTWKTWNDKWVDIDVSDVQNVLNNGIVASVFNSRTKAEWSSLVNGSKKIRFGYALSIANSAAQSNLDAISINIDMHGRWKQDKDSDVFFAGSGTVQVQLYSTGDYKINY